MPFTVITLSKTPASLRGDLTKWMQEISTGVYVGNFNRRIRDKLWERVKENVGNGEATISYAAQNEIGYRFESYNTSRQMIELEGIPLVLLPQTEDKGAYIKQRGFSNASKFRKARKFSRPNSVNVPSYIILDTETTGLDPKKDQMIEIGALKIEGAEENVFHSLIANKKIPEQIQKLTGISQKDLDEDGKDESQVLANLLEFIEGQVIVGYNINFDISFINEQLKNMGQENLSNPILDLKTIIKKEKMFLKNYQLQTVIASYGINKKVPHRALEDVRLMAELISKVNKFPAYLKKKAR
ncbi:type I-E CRISPR-associated endoribonuclease Cas2e [Aerococcus sanguinicola]|uniref:type I-E CRISPR-associated endoribonuclease Cas2e n=1 Tax=unclassified Aerococcus TaxID=2618060 RepID=UPI0008A4F6CE|nr:MULTISPECIES: type I-E CRISPR-associated endoribonuclease Cas2e [unclassified Aerococcus]KAB0647996.1 type I-E CRISPR-associated endoribonuclease Cas2 [Aerococcus sanguinicola]MDK6233502.1 type I-E CRISPR-associated endoribonuclease Cas2e [Aerococcus sp. UMB10185]MDK6855515.1 type I-E CRISPR-associated endoribonuclease Cas2e [Aerococcus sp. UMB7533]MDK8502235.1 type I-E CRISPR-associated endoribonuclease Cas2e [Aerococcus sp. UMB1112A]OFN02358.1 type I-E CRISPR-associated endoribonuclease C